MKITSRKFFRVLIIILICAAAVAVIGIVCVNGFVNNKMEKINHVDTAEVEWVAPEEETFEVTVSAGSDTITQKEAEEIFDADNVSTKVDRVSINADSNSTDVDSVNTKVDSVSTMDDNDIKNILLIGTDAREGETQQRSDTNILCSINTRDKKITLVSFMRDMYVPIPGYSPNRINAAYAFGGMELLDQTIEQDFGIPVHGNVEVDFEGFIEAFGVIGNIEMELTEEEAEYLSTYPGLGSETDESDEVWELHEGVNELTPSQALGFSRMRRVGNSDWDRTDRQRRLLMAGFNKIGQLDTAQMLELADEIFPYLSTDMTNKELLSYIKTVSVVGISNVESKRLPVDGYYTSETINGMSVLVPNLPSNSEMLKEWLYGDEADEELLKLCHISDETAGGADSSASAGSAQPAG